MTANTTNAIGTTRFCDSCRFFRTYSVDAYLGECRRYAPRPCLEGDPGASAPSAGWPKVSAEDWCGEHEPRPPQALPQAAAGYADDDVVYDPPVPPTKKIGA